VSRYQAYPEYKESGVAWLGETPTSWTLAPLKWFIDRNDGGVWGDDPDGENDTLVLRSTEQTVDGLWKMDDPAPRKLSASDKKFALLRSGDLVVTKSSGSSLHIGKTTIVTDVIERLECCYSNFMQRIRTSRLLLPKLAWYVMNNELSRAQLDFLSNSTTGLANLNGTMIGQVFLAIPSKFEQQAIVNFLDHETAKIDALIEKQQRLIELLKEKRQAVISHAVTKGLNPNAPMKDSGVEWLGEVPLHWVVAGFKKYLSSSVDYRGKTPDKTDSGVFLVTARNIKNGKINYELAQEYISESDYSTVMSRGKPKIGDLLFTTEAPLGEVAAVDREDIALAQRIIKFNFDSGILLNRYMKYYIMSDQFQQSLMMFASGSTALGIKAERLVYLRTLAPPLDEQEAIVDHIESISMAVDVLIEKAITAIGLMQERRTALISAAVTGKIDVRDWQAAA
jgi:type I restriction enzyme S subunit